MLDNAHFSVLGTAHPDCRAFWDVKPPQQGQFQIPYYDCVLFTALHQSPYSGSQHHYRSVCA